MNQQEKARHWAFAARAEDDVVRHYIDKKGDAGAQLHYKPFKC